jgi:hypothetical protein
MYGQMTAGSWIYIGTQGILLGTYETFAAVAAKRFGGTITLTSGLGGMGGARPPPSVRWPKVQPPRTELLSPCVRSRTLRWCASM